MKLQYFLDVSKKGASKTPPLYAGSDIHQVIDRIQRVFEEAEVCGNGRKILVLEGPAAAGKSVLAQRLALSLSAPLVPMDDFFLPFDMRTEERFAEVGGNIHHERFAAEIIGPATANQEAFTYCPFDCQTGEFSAPVEIPASPYLVIEGVYSLHAHFDHYWSLALLLGVDPGLQRSRILQRETEEAAKRYFERWLPLESPYFQDPRLLERVDLKLTSSIQKTGV